MLGKEQPQSMAVLEAESKAGFQTDLQVGNKLKQTRKASNHAVIRRESDEIASYQQVKQYMPMQYLNSTIRSGGRLGQFMKDYE